MLVAHGLLVLAIDGSRMQLFRNRGSEAKPQLELIDEDRFDNPATHVLGQDKPGRSFGSSSAVRHAYAADDLHEDREREFGAGAIERLFEKISPEAQIILIAPPRMLGNLRKSVAPSLKHHIVASFDKDFADASPTDIADFLKDQRI